MECVLTKFFELPNSLPIPSTYISKFLEKILKSGIVADENFLKKSVGFGYANQTLIRR